MEEKELKENFVRVSISLDRQTEEHLQALLAAYHIKNRSRFFKQLIRKEYVEHVGAGRGRR